MYQVTVQYIEFVKGLTAMELLDIVDRQGNPTGETVDRETAHREGILHRTSHVWIYRIQQGRPQLLLQKRCSTKDSFPGCYDISSAGHIPAGDGFRQSAIRELQEELGVEAREEALVSCGLRFIVWDDCFHGKPFHDRQISEVFVLWLQDHEEQDFVLQETELERVRWMGLQEVADAVRGNTIPNCIVLEELRMLEQGDSRLKFE